MLAVTHIVTSTDASGTCPRTLKYLLGVVTGKWIVNTACEYVFYCNFALIDKGWMVLEGRRVFQARRGLRSSATSLERFGCSWIN